MNIQNEFTLLYKQIEKDILQKYERVLNDAHPQTNYSEGRVEGIKDVIEDIKTILYSGDFKINTEV